MRYYSGKGAIFIILIAFMLCLSVISFSDKAYIPMCMVLIIVVYLVWMWIDTYYIIENEQLFYKSALLKGSIPVNAIHEVVKNKTQYSGIKASLSTKGIIVKYNRWDDIYISPKDTDRFINELKAINPDIKVSG